MANRTPEEIRASIEANRVELAHSLVRLRGEVAEITDWRGQIVKHQKQVLIGAAASGFVLGGGIVISAEWYWPIQETSSVSTPPMFPCPEPP